MQQNILVTSKQLKKVMSEMTVQMGNEDNIPQYNQEVTKVLTEAKIFLAKGYNILLNTNLREIMDTPDKYIRINEQFSKVSDNVLKKYNHYYKVNESLEESDIDPRKIETFSRMVEELGSLNDDIGTLVMYFEELCSTYFEHKNFFHTLEKQYPDNTVAV